MANFEQLPGGLSVQAASDAVPSIEGRIHRALRQITSHVTKEPREGSMTYRFHKLPTSDDALEALCKQIVADAGALPESVTKIVIDLHELDFILEGGFALILWSLPKRLRAALPGKGIRIVGIQPHVKQKLETLQISPHIPATLEYAEAAETSSETAS